MAETHSWQVVAMVRGGCNLSTESEFIQEGWPGYEECATWRAELVDRIVSLEPDLVVSLGTRTGPDPARRSSRRASRRPGVSCRTRACV
jgi:hypothetical protein